MPSHAYLPDELSRWVVQALTRLLATYAILQGAVIVIGGSGRWRSPSLAVAMQVPGAPATWGVFLSMFGAAALAGTFLVRMKLTAFATAMVGVWCMFFSVSQLWSATYDGHSGTTGIGTYAVLAVVAMVLSIAYRKAA